MLNPLQTFWRAPFFHNPERYHYVLWCFFLTPQPHRGKLTARKLIFCEFLRVGLHQKLLSSGRNDAIPARIHGPVHQPTLRSPRALAPRRCHGGDHSRGPLPVLRRFLAKRAATSGAAISDAAPGLDFASAAHGTALKSGLHPARRQIKNPDVVSFCNTQDRP
jgi:hypothetical protein